jgi:two-component system, OmpR family, phosphate regulon sensor histidine kinase PhoR
MEQNVMKIADLLEQEKDGVIETWKQEIAQSAREKNLDLDEAALTDSMADVLRELTETLRCGMGEEIREYKFCQAPIEHGVQRVHVGFDIEEVITEYNILRDVLQDKA